MDNNTNPLKEFIDDNTYNLLNENGLLNPTVVRNYEIKQIYNNLKRTHKKVRQPELIDIIKEKHFPYLQPDTIRKALYL